MSRRPPAPITPPRPFADSPGGRILRGVLAGTGATAPKATR